MLQLLDPRGRCGRADWWVLSVGGCLFSQIAAVGALVSRHGEGDPHWIAFAALAALSLLSLWLPLAATARRFRDRGESPWLTLLVLFPLVGWFWVLVCCGIAPDPERERTRVVRRQVIRGDSR